MTDATTKTCAETRLLLHALLDGELDASHAREIEAHIASCAGCTAQLNSYRDMRQKLRAQNLRFAAPAGLHARIGRIAPPHQSLATRRSLLKGFAAGGVLSGAIAASLMLVVGRGDRDSRILHEAVSAHLRSLQADHLTDVLSTDQHTVKPWFNGRIDVAPPVIDLTAQGFTLIGGRLDYIDAKPVAAIVYRRRIHIINLFAAQDLGIAARKPEIETVQGFNIRRWREQGLDLLAVSDLNAEELEEFGDKLEAALRSNG